MRPPKGTARKGSSFCRLEIVLARIVRHLCNAKFVLRLNSGIYTLPLALVHYKRNLKIHDFLSASWSTSCRSLSISLSGLTSGFVQVI